MKLLPILSLSVGVALTVISIICSVSSDTFSQAETTLNGWQYLSSIIVTLGAPIEDSQYYTILKPTPIGFDSTSLGRIRAGRPSLFPDARTGESIEISFVGAAPQQHQLLQVLVGAENRTYLIPLVFVPKIPQKICQLYILMGLVLLAVFVAGSIWAIWKLYVAICNRPRKKPVPQP